MKLVEFKNNGEVCFLNPIQVISARVVDKSSPMELDIVMADHGDPDVSPILHLHGDEAKFLLNKLRKDSVE